MARNRFAWTLASVAVMALSVTATARTVRIVQTSSVGNEPGMLEIAVEVELSCPSCAQGLERRLGRLDHVTRIDIHAEAGRIVLGVAPGTTVDTADVRQVIRNAGFMPTAIVVIALGHVVEVGGSPALALGGDDRLLLAPGAQTDALRAAAASDGDSDVLTVTDFEIL